MNTGVALLTGTAVGAGLMYLLDPDRGRRHRRRDLVRDQAVSLGHEAQDAVSGKAQDLSNRAQGLAAETRGLVEEAGSTLRDKTQDMTNG